MMHSSWRYIIDWTSRMARRFGGTVIDRDGNKMDWGQAIVREMYGPDWNQAPAFKIENDKDASVPLDPAVVERAKRWESGEYPKWWLAPDVLDEGMI